MSASNDWETCPYCSNNILRWEDDGGNLTYTPHAHQDWSFDGQVRCPFCGYETYYISDPMNYIEPDDEDEDWDEDEAWENQFGDQPTSFNVNPDPQNIKIAKIIFQAMKDLEAINENVWEHLQADFNDGNLPDYDETGVELVDLENVIMTVFTISIT